MTDYDALACEAAAYARANAAEAEVERLRGLLAEAEEAIRDLVRAGDAMRFSMPTAAMAGKSAWDDVRNQPAVRRALAEIGGEG